MSYFLEKLSCRHVRIVSCCVVPMSCVNVCATRLIMSIFKGDCEDNASYWSFIISFEGNINIKILLINRLQDIHVVISSNWKTLAPTSRKETTELHKASKSWNHIPSTLEEGIPCEWDIFLTVRRVLQNVYLELLMPDMIACETQSKPQWHSTDDVHNNRSTRLSSHFFQYWQGRARKFMKQLTLVEHHYAIVYLLLEMR